MAASAGHDECAALRSDAARNRRLLVAAAREVFAEQGLTASTNEVARRAGVGVATLFRRFPTRDALVAAAFEDKMAAYGDAVRDALEDPDPWQGFRDFLTRVCAMQAEDRGFADVLTMSFPTAKGLEKHRNRTVAGLKELIARAQESGGLRADFVHQDVPLILMANAGVVTGTASAAPEAWRRFVALTLQACAADHAAPLPEPPSPRQLYRALLRLRREPR